MSATILQIERLVKNFRSHWTFRPIEAVRDVSLSVYRGESFGFLGPNGAGKTTTIKCIMGLVKLTAGRMFFDDEPLKSHHAHRHMGYLPELPYFYEHLSVQETIEFFASLHGITGKERRKRVEEVLKRVGLQDKQKHPVYTLSKGFQQRLGFAQAIINRPMIVFLDEPFSGLDPVGRREMRELICELKARGTTVFLCSHILSDVEEICDRVAIMARGQLKATFYLKDIPALFGEKFEVSVGSLAKVSPTVIDQVQGLALQHRIHESANGAVSDLLFEHYEKARHALELLSRQNVRIFRFQSLGLRLEEIFVKITSESNAQFDTSTPLIDSDREEPRV